MQDRHTRKGTPRVPQPSTGGLAGSKQAAREGRPPSALLAAPASESGPLDPAFRANPFPEVTDLFCRLPLPTLFYGLEADHLGDLMRL